MEEHEKAKDGQRNEGTGKGIRKERSRSVLGMESRAT